MDEHRHRRVMYALGGCIFPAETQPALDAPWFRVAPNAQGEFEVTGVERRTTTHVS